MRPYPVLLHCSTPTFRVPTASSSPTLPPESWVQRFIRQALDVRALRRCGLGLMMTLIADHVAEILSQRAGWGGGGGHSLCNAAPQASLDAEAALLQQVIVADGAEAPGAPGVKRSVTREL